MTIFDVKASLDRKSTTGGCQFLGRRLISWQCKKQTIAANSTTEAEYVAAANSCGQVLWIQNQMMDYGFNFMNTKIHIDNESTISVIKNPVAHSRTKHIEIHFHFIRDCYEKRLIEVIKIHTDSNVADLLTKGFDVTRFNFLVVSIGMISMDLRMDRSCAANSTHIWSRVLVGIIEGHRSANKKYKHLKAQIKKLKKKAKPVITHHKAWMKSVSMKQRLTGKKSLKKKWMQKESVSKQGRKSAKSEPTVHKDPAFDDLDDVDVNDVMDYMETDAYMQKGVSTKDQVSTVKLDEGTDKPKVSTNKPEVSTAKPKEVEVSTDNGFDEGSLKRKFDQLDKVEENSKKARIEAYRILATRLPKRKKGSFTVKREPKILYDTIAEKEVLAQQRGLLPIKTADHKHETKLRNNA
ncbi:hypothetical protein Tco_0218942 [Tanacetum coccineum]